MPFVERGAVDKDIESESEHLLADDSNSNEISSQHRHLHQARHKSHIKQHAGDNLDHDDDDDDDEEAECKISPSAVSKSNRAKLKYHHHRQQQHDDSLSLLKDRLQSKQRKSLSSRNKGNLEADDLQKSSDSSTNSILVDIGLVSDFDASPLIQLDDEHVARANHERLQQTSLERVQKRHSFIRPDSDNETRDGHHHHHVLARARMNNQHGLANPGFDPEERNGSVGSSSSGAYHCHLPRNDPSFHKQKNSVAFRKLITVLIMCIFFMVAEIVGGVLAHSISSQTDAAHMAADIAGFALSSLALHLSSKSKIPQMVNRKTAKVHVQ